MIDAGWMALSRDRGTAAQRVDQGCGPICCFAGRPHPDLIVAFASQKHGTVALRPGLSAALPDLLGATMVRILPNHACATGAQHERYHVLSGGALAAEWPRIRGW